MRKTIKTLCTLLVCLAMPLPAAADESDAVIEVIDRFFAAMTDRDADTLRSLLTGDGMLYGYRETDEGLAIVRLTHEAWLNGVVTSETVPVERYWDPETRIVDRMATAWTPYDFYRDGVFSHCGTNTFSLMRTDDGWVITGAVFSIRSEDCPPSPLGPFGDAEE